MVENKLNAKKFYPFLFEKNHFWIEKKLDRSINFNLQNLNELKNIDIVHSLTEYNEFLIPPQTKLIVSIHDCTFFKYPKKYDQNLHLKSRYTFKNMVKIFVVQKMTDTVYEILFTS